METATPRPVKDMTPGADSSPRTAERVLLVSLPYAESQTAQQLGQEGYSYQFVYRAFQRLLERWGCIQEVTQPESRLNFAARQAGTRGRLPIHLSFLPLHRVYPTGRAPTVAFPFWEFPEIPNTTLDQSPRHDWVRIAQRLDLIVCASHFTADAFRRAGVTTPIRVIPVPIDDEYFTLPAWQPGQQVVLQSACHVFPEPPRIPAQAQSPWVREQPPRLGLRAQLQRIYQRTIKPRLPEHVRSSLNLVRRAAEAALQIPPQPIIVDYPSEPVLDLSGIVYTSIINPFDPRKNWQDLLSAFLIGLRDCEDATLVIKVVASPSHTAHAIHGMVGYYRQLGLRHRCRLVLLPGYLSDEHMRELTRATTYYVNTARAEGACLPLQSFLAAGRPALAPVHSALSDYFHDGLGYVIQSHPEPASWPHDPSQRLTTSWHRLVWQSLHDGLQASYQIARQAPKQYAEMAARGREQMAAYASADEVWPQLADALDSVHSSKKEPARRAAVELAEKLRVAS